MKQVHLGPVEGKKGLSEEEALAKARKMKANDLGIPIRSKEPYFFEAKTIDIGSGNA